MTGTDEERTHRGSPGPLDDLARQYLDLWQDQLTALSADPAISQAISGFFAKWAQAPAPAAPPSPGAEPGAAAASATGTGEGQDERRSDQPQSSAVAAPLRPAFVDGDDRFGELLERLDRIEERLARLERS